VRGFDEAHIARCLDGSWVWRNVVVAETDAEAERIAVPAFEAMQENRRRLRERIYAEQGIRMVEEKAPPARVQVEHALIHGSPATVAARMAEIERTGVGGVICAFRLGPMPAEVARHSIRLFMTQVAPQFRGGRAAVAAAAE
jgi:alkanesulfonate monooxygenase SsuD/methylene tetrahydromethanopterin reductase-like flavin-dependent oxidoreductase (luciferase family)